MAKSTKSRMCSVAVLALVAVGAQAQTGYQKGPAPTASSIQAAGPFAVTTQTITGSGFGGGTVYSPNTPGSYALVAVCPGFASYQSSISQISQRLATHGFVVVTIDTNSPYDQPSSRATQLLAALKATAALKTGAVAGKIDTGRQAVAGWSMGGGGTLIAATSTPGLKGAVAFAPYATNSSFTTDSVPAAILGGSSDTVAPPAQYATPFYNAIPATTPKLLGIISGAQHTFPTTASQPASYVEIAWFKRFLDNDTRYSQFLTGDPKFSTFKSNGPF